MDAVNFWKHALDASELLIFFFFNIPATTEIYTVGNTLSLHDALPICFCFGGYFDLRVLAGTFATGARILFAYMLETFEMSRDVFDLPALLAADLLALYTATRAGPLFSAQLVYVG